MKYHVLVVPRYILTLLAVHRNMIFHDRPRQYLNNIGLEYQFYSTRKSEYLYMPLSFAISTVPLYQSKHKTSDKVQNYSTH